jgi:hypothetical protein
MGVPVTSFDIGIWCVLGGLVSAVPHKLFLLSQGVGHYFQQMDEKG